jgi:heme oxygenase
VYTALEARLEQEALAKPRGEGGIVAPIFFPWELNRVAALEDDLEHWLGAEWRTAPEMEPSPCTKEYVQRLERASAAGIVAHAYTRYMGDLSGGQVLLRKAQKAFGLQRDCTDGLSFYTFSNIEKPKAFKDSYRLELDRLEPERHLAQEIVAEANVVSGLHALLAPLSYRHPNTLVLWLDLSRSLLHGVCAVPALRSELLSLW